MADESTWKRWATARPRALWIAVLIAGLLLPARAADLQAGLDAYDRGDYETAASEFLPLAENGNPEAQFRLAIMHEYNKGPLGNPLEAFRWYRQAAENGHPEAQIQLAIQYRDGFTVQRDLVEAYAWFDIAAGNGIKNAEWARDEIGKSLAPDVLARAKERATYYLERAPR